MTPSFLWASFLEHLQFPPNFMCLSPLSDWFLFQGNDNIWLFCVLSTWYRAQNIIGTLQRVLGLNPCLFIFCHFVVLIFSILLCSCHNTLVKLLVACPSSVVIKSIWVWNWIDWVLALYLTGYVTLGKILNLSSLSFTLDKMEIIKLLKWWWRWNSRVYHSSS